VAIFPEVEGKWRCREAKLTVDSVGVSDLKAHLLGDGSQVCAEDLLGLGGPVLVVASAEERCIAVLAVDVERGEVHQDEVAAAGGVEGVDLVEDTADVVYKMSV